MSDDATSLSLDNRISVVLVRPIYPRNVGMVARAAANLGLSRLLVIGDFEISEEAKQGAAGAQQVLKNYIHYLNWEKFIEAEGEGFRIAFSARDGKMRPPNEFSSFLKSLSPHNYENLVNDNTPIYLIFGPEDDGLSNEDLNLAHSICQLPVFGEFTSYNLSHACLLAMYILRDFLKQNTNRETNQPSRPTTQGTSRAPVFFPEKSIRQWLEKLGFDLSASRVNAEKILCRILLENVPNPSELKVLESIIQQTIRKLPEKVISPKD